MITFSETMFGYHWAESHFEEKLVEAGFGEFCSISGDHYDNSIEIHGVKDGAELGAEAQEVIYDAGFSIAFVNYNDGTERHYHFDLGKPFKEVKSNEFQTLLGFFGF